MTHFKQCASNFDKYFCLSRLFVALGDRTWHEIKNIKLPAVVMVKWAECMTSTYSDDPNYNLAEVYSVR